jgi:hypothetical protein
MTIREALPKDRDALVGIWLRSVRATHIGALIINLRVAAIRSARSEVRGQRVWLWP